MKTEVLERRICKSPTSHMCLSFRSRARLMTSTLLWRPISGPKRVPFGITSVVHAPSFCDKQTSSRNENTHYLTKNNSASTPVPRITVWRWPPAAALLRRRQILIGSRNENKGESTEKDSADFVDSKENKSVASWQSWSKEGTVRHRQSNEASILYIHLYSHKLQPQNK